MPETAVQLGLMTGVPPFPAEIARRLVEAAFGAPIDAIFASFEAEAVASASIAQVHFAVLKDGREVAVKVLRPGMLAAIEDDLALIMTTERNTSGRTNAHHAATGLPKSCPITASTLR